MKIIDKVKKLLGIVKIHLQNENIHDDVSHTAFILSLIPIQGLQQCNQIIDRIASNKALKIRFDDIWKAINESNSNVAGITDELEKIQEIGATVNYNEKLKSQVEQFRLAIIEELKSDKKSQWIMETENFSYQEILNSIIKADFVGIIAKDNSTNIIKSTEITAEKTHLHASGGSQNFVNRTKFVSGAGSVGMDGISTQGDIIIEGSGITLLNGGALILERNPNLVSGECPFCKRRIEFNERDLDGFSSIVCPNNACGITAPFNIN